MGSSELVLQDRKTLPKKKSTRQLIISKKCSEQTVQRGDDSIFENRLFPLSQMNKGNISEDVEKTIRQSSL